MINPYEHGSLSGEYEPKGSIDVHDAATAVAAFGFGYREDGPGLSNEATAQFVETHLAFFPVLASKDVADAFKYLEPDLLVDEERTNTMGAGAGTWGELLVMEKYMAAHGLRRLILTGNARHVPRIDRQVRALNARPNAYSIETIVPRGLPDVFDPKSQQWWTRSGDLWILRELGSAIKLRMDGELL